MREVLPFTAIIPGMMTTCRYCGSTDVRLSKSVYYSGSTHYTVLRCNTCNAHFKVARLSIRELLPILSYILLVLLLAMFMAFIYVSTTQEVDLTQNTTLYVTR